MPFLLEGHFVLEGFMEVEEHGLPVTDDYISRPYTINKQHYVVRNERLIRSLYSKSMRYLKLLEQGVMKDQNHVLYIRNQLVSR